MSSASPSLSDKRRRMLELLLATNGAGLKQTARLRRLSPSDNHPPLSFAQQRLWFLDQLVPNSPFYNVPAAIRISAPLRPDLMQSTLNEIIKRHEVLRTSFQERGGKPFQVIAPVLEIPFELRDLRSLNPAVREQVCLKLVTENATKPFDLSRGPLIRALLLQLDEADYVFLINLHHIIADGWSMGVMVEEFRQIYSAFAQGLASPLPELPLQYADFAVWQQNRLEAGELQQQLNYWTNKLQDLPLLALPTDFPHRDVQGFEGETIYYNLPAQLSNDIHSFSQKNGVTVYVTLLAAFNALLYRYTGQDEIIIGEPVANRNYLELEPLIGFFVNSLVLRTDVSADPTFRELLRRSRKEVLEVDANQDIPFEVLVDRLKPERTMGRNPLFQVSLQYFSGATTSPADAGLPSESLRIEKGTASLDLAFDLAESPAGIVARIEYSTELFRRDTIEQMAAHFENLLAAFIANPELRISQMPMVSVAEREQLLTAGNSRLPSSSDFVGVHELFEAQVRRTPDLTAVSSGSRKLTYHELNERANRLARKLQADGIGPEKLVAICLNRSIEAVVAVLAVWKAGGAYVPLDPSLPEERFRFVIDDAKPDLLLTAPELESRMATDSTDNIDPACGPENLAYIIYTSGSSGVPKGVMIEHGALSRHLQWMQAEFPLTTSDRTLFKYSFSFDVSIVEMLQPLLAGAAMEVMESNGPLDVSKVAKVISDLSITSIDVVPSMLSALLDNPLFVAKKSLRRVICGGEMMPPDLLKRLRDRLDVEFVNMYGPTEATITATYWRADEVPQNRIPIGRPAAPYSAYVLDRDGNLTPPGVPGELYLGGACLARGYVGRGDLTNQSFIRDPFSNDTAARLYRTGDRCRFGADGNLEFLGRMDEQIKVRAYRIELGEIEAVLRANPTVKSCVVNVVSSGGHTQLAAYVVPNLGNVEFWPSIGEYFVYDGLMYAIMSSDRVRAEAY
ncbi:MAG TPA: amino acid adenylation domain-containing protein, partial [Pyrinomonadaceae bacterium]|nr:amino acid adenylation domain-containing protein [Pyrinomonadaceae bacterium]